MLQRMSQVGFIYYQYPHRGELDHVFGLVCNINEHDNAIGQEGWTKTLTKKPDIDACIRHCSTRWDHFSYGKWSNGGKCYCKSSVKKRPDKGANQGWFTGDTKCAKGD